MIFFCFRYPAVLFGRPGISILSRNRLYLLKPCLCFFIILKHDLFVYRDDSLTSQRVTMQTKQPTKFVVPLQKLRVARKTSLAPPINSLLTVPMRFVLLWFSVACFGVRVSVT